MLYKWYNINSMRKNNLALISFLCLMGFAVFAAAGCREYEPKVSEKAVKFVNDGVFSPGGSIQIVMDAFGYLNGVLEINPMHTFNRTIVEYTGDWTIKSSIPTKYDPFYIAISTTPGDRVDMVATISAVTFNFVGKDWFSDAGDVTLFIDDKPAGNITFLSGEADTYVLLMPEIGLHKVSLVLNSGGVCISGYAITVPVEKKDFYQEMLEKQQQAQQAQQAQQGQ
jgi:hypothetical protein